LNPGDQSAVGRASPCRLICPKGIQKMATLNMTESELEKLIKRAIINTLTERSDLLENAVAEAILDMKLGLAIEEGDTGEYADEKQISLLLGD
jgi:hypothetical protein